MQEKIRKIPLAYLITFTCYGTWLHGDERGSVDRKHNEYQAPLLETNTRRKNHETNALKSPPVFLNERMREIVSRTVEEVCVHRRWTLHEQNVRTNHVHVVVSGEIDPDKIMKDLKAYATRRLAEAGEVRKGMKV